MLPNYLTTFLSNFLVILHHKFSIFYCEDVMNIFKQSFFLLTVLFLTSCSLNSEYLPEDIFGMRLTKKLTGEEAKKFVNKLHGKTVADTENEIGHYRGDRGKALIYVAHYQKPEDARRYYGEMTEKISLGKSVFISPEFIDIGGKKVYRTFGMGQSHYIFLYNKNLFWISVDTFIGKKFVEEYISYIKNM